MRNLPTGLYRNHLGVELHVISTAMPATGVNTLELTHRDNGAFTADRETQDRHEPRHRADQEQP